MTLKGQIKVTGSQVKWLYLSLQWAVICFIDQAGYELSLFEVHMYEKLYGISVYLMTWFYMNWYT